MLVIDDGSEDATAASAAAAGAAVVRLPFNLGIGGAVQTGFKYALEHGYDTVSGSTATGSTTRRRSRSCSRRSRATRPTSSSAPASPTGDGDYRPPFARRAGIRWFAHLVSLLTRQKLTDTTSGFQAVNARAIRLFAADYPHDYPEVEAAVMVVRHQLRILEVPAPDARPRDGRVVDHRAPLPVLRDQGDAGALRRHLPPQRRSARGGMSPMTPLYVSIVASVASILLILVVLELIRSRRLRERYALLWLATGTVLLVLSAWRGGLNTIAGWLGVTGYPPAVLFAVATLFILAVLLHYSTVISKLADQNVILAQRLALLEQRQGGDMVSGTASRVTDEGA